MPDTSAILIPADSVKADSVKADSIANPAGGTQ
jgi:hypothetical protein